MEGNLHLGPNANFRPKHVGVASGRIIVRNFGWLIAEDQSSLELLGDNENDHLLTLGFGGVIVAPDNMDHALIFKL